MTDKAIKNQQKALKSLMVQACHDYGNPSVQHIFVNRYNQAVVGIHEYYSMATMVNEDMHRMFISIDKTMKCRCAGKNFTCKGKADEDKRWNRCVYIPQIRQVETGSIHKRFYHCSHSILQT